MEKLKSIRQSHGGVRGSVKSLVGRGDDGFAQARGRADAHSSTPLSALKDPASFAPPPKHSGVYSGGEDSAETRPSSTASPASPVRPLPNRLTGGRGTADQQTAEAAIPPSGPFRVDTTGLSTAHLPKPPVNRNGIIGASMQDQTVSASTVKVKKPGPPLPPRLPPRSAVASAIPTSPPPPYYSPTASSLATVQESQSTGNLLNQDAIRRLGSAGVSVPGLDIVSRTETADRVHVNQTTGRPFESQTHLANLASAAASNRAGKASSLESLTGQQPVTLPAKPVFARFAKDAQSSLQDGKPGPPPVPLNTKPR